MQCRENYSSLNVSTFLIRIIVDYLPGVNHTLIMSTPERGSPVLPQAESTATIPAEAPAAPASSFDNRVKDAKTPADLKRLREEYLKPVEPKPTEAVTPAAEESPAAETPAEPTTEAAETPAETPATGEGVEQPNTESDENAGEEDDGGEGPVTPLTAKRAHLRFAETDKVGRLAASYLKRNRDMSMEDALVAAKKQLGIKDPAAKPDSDAPKTNPDLPQTIEEVDSTEEQLLATRQKEFVGLNFEEVAKIDVQLRKLDRHRANLEKQAAKQESEAITSYASGFAASESKAAELYDFASKPETPGGKRMIEIESMLKENDDPLYSDPNKPLRIAQMVAAELGIAPRRKGALTPAPAPKPAAPVAPVAKKGVVPSGASRTTPAVTTKPAIDAEILAAKNPYELRKVKEKYGIPVG